MTLTSRWIITEAAMKLNMMVVMTMWLPRRACSQAGTKAQEDAEQVAGLRGGVSAPAGSSRIRTPAPR